MVNRSKTVKFCALTAGLAAVAGGALDAAKRRAPLPVSCDTGPSVSGRQR